MHDRKQINVKRITHSIPWSDIPNEKTDGRPERTAKKVHPVTILTGRRPAASSANSKNVKKRGDEVIKISQKI